MKKIGKLGLTIAMVLAMAIGTTATAFAATTSATVTDTETAISKTYTAAEASLLTETSFEYKLAYVNSTAVGTNTPAEEPTGDLPKTVNVTVTKASDDATEATGAIDYAELFEGITFSAPGYYNFTLKETSSGNPNITYDSTIYNIQVQVVWNDVAQGTLKVAGITATAQGAEKKSDNAAFNNRPAATGSLTVTKTVAGNAANTNDEFKFTVTLSGVDGKYTATINGNPDKAAEKGNNVYTLKHGQTLTISNLPVGATYTVTEADATETNGVYVVDGYTVTDSQTPTDDNLAEGKIASGDNSVTFTNTKDVEPIMGVFMDVLPYALIVVVAAAACFFFMTRRRNREDY